jgi:predicted membrane metal-binding protein
MSYAWLIGVVVGVLVAVGMIVIAGLLGRKRLRQACDERT